MLVGRGVLLPGAPDSALVTRIYQRFNTTESPKVVAHCVRIVPASVSSYTVPVKKLLGILSFITILTVPSFSALNTIEELENKNSQWIITSGDINHFLDDGYEITAQVTKNKITVFVLQKGEKYVGCRATKPSIVTTCYNIVLKYAE